MKKFLAIVLNVLIILNIFSINTFAAESLQVKDVYDNSATTQFVNVFRSAGIRFTNEFRKLIGKDEKAWGIYFSLKESIIKPDRDIKAFTTYYAYPANLSDENSQFNIKFYKYADESNSKKDSTANIQPVSTNPGKAPSEIGKYLMVIELNGFQKAADIKVQEFKN